MAQSSENATPPPLPHPYMQRLKKQKKLMYVHWPVSHAAEGMRALRLLALYQQHQITQSSDKRRGEKPRLAFHTSHAEAGVSFKEIELSRLS